MPVESRLRAEVAARRLEADGAQLDAALRLDQLSASLLDASRSVGARLRTHLSWLPPSSADAPRGLYLWGGVGRGKTMLMDWFYASLRVPQRERSHYYRFMRGVHAQLRAVERRAAAGAPRAGDLPG
jgi:cell division protein ZapE